MTKRLVRVRYRNPKADGDSPFKGIVVARATLMRHVEGGVPDDFITTKAKFSSTAGAALSYTDNEGNPQVAPAEAGAAWFWIDVNDEAPYANLWAWIFTARPASDERCVQVPTGVGICEFGDLPPLNKADFTEADAPLPGWSAALAAEGALARNADNLTSGTVPDARLSAAIARTTDITAAVNALLDGTPGALDTLNELAAALGDDANFATTVTNALAAKATTADLAAETAARIAATAAPLVTKRTLGDIALANTGSGFADLDDTGTPNARNLDIVFPNVTAGQVVELELNLLSSNAAGIGFLTFASIVAGSPVNRIHGTNTGGVAGWFLPASEFGKATGAVPYTLQAGDIEDGNARFRPQYKSAGSKTIYANSTSTYTLTVVGRGPKG